MTGWFGVRLVRGFAAIALFALAAFVSASAARAQDASVSIVDFAFDSPSITVEAGSTVTWTNVGNANHTVTADDGTFDSGTLGSGESFSFTFATPGTYGYHCTIHPNMTAQVIVVAAGGNDTGGDTGDADSGNGTTMPSTGVGSAASHDLPAAFLVLALVLAGSSLLVGKRLARQ
jgi:plastocyanin